MDLVEYERISPQMQVSFEGKTVTFATPNQQTAWRVQTLYTKEPDTIEWLKGFGPNDVLIDVGANVGMYSVLAAAMGARVFAFEPESQNYAILNRNIYLNGFAELVSAYCTAISDVEGFSHLYLSEFAIGGSCHNFGESIDYNYKPLSASYKQGAYATTLDRLIEQGTVPAATALKIDVDGIEPKVIAGARKLLESPELRSVLIEINTNLEDHWEVIDLMLDSGFDYSAEEADQARRKEGAFKGVGNYVFRR